MSDADGSRSAVSFGMQQNIFVRALPIAAFIVFGGLFVQHLLSLDMDALGQALREIALWQWIASLALTALSFAALGSYDVLVHKVLGTGIPPRLARSAGIKAIAVAQTLGFGAITGGFVRWQCLPNLSAFAVARLSAVVSLTFLAALAVVGALVVPWAGLIANTQALLFGAVLALIGLWTLARLAHRQGWLPHALDRSTISALIIATFVDTAAAAGALWVLWPEAISFQIVFAAYLIALGAGLVSNAPGGLGAFDLTLLALIPMGAAEPATCAILAFRITYYIVPTAIALALMIRPPKTQSSILKAHPEGTLSLQSATISQKDGTSYLTLPTFVGPVILGKDTALPDVQSLPSDMLYKVDKRTAAAARTAGFAVMRCANEALIDLDTWTLDGPKRRQLRRALKAFGTSGVVIAQPRDPARLNEVSAEWSDLHGQERGLSMGQYDPSYLAHQMVFAAYSRGRPIAFVSFHVTGGMWTLDLVRYGSDVPKGTMQALICSVIDHAKAKGVTILSLAAVPAPEPHLPFAARALSSSQGLRRFKSAFAPRWTPRYLCARGPVRLTLAALALAYGIHRPGSVQSNDVANLPQIHDEENSFASAAPPCDAPIST